MYCKDTESCFDEIKAYSDSSSNGRALLVNTENYDVFQAIRAKMETDPSKQCVYVSDFCPENGIPLLDDIPAEGRYQGDWVLIGYSQAAFMRSADYLEGRIGKFLEMPVRGHAIILLDHCEQFLKKHFRIHPDIEKRVLLVDGEVSTMPKIRLAKSANECGGCLARNNFKQLLVYMESLRDAERSNHPEIAVITSLSERFFDHASYSVSKIDSIYVRLKKQYIDVAAGTEECFGTDEQWLFLSDRMAEYGSLSGVADAVFGSTSYLFSHIGEVLEENDPLRIWLLWLSLKVFGAKGNQYMTKVLQASTSVDDLEDHVYGDILSTKHDAAEFRQLYTERKRLLNEFSDNLTALDRFLQKVGRYQKDAVYYLTDRTEKEERAFMDCMSLYEYTDEELLQITELTFPELYCYLQPFTFNRANMTVPDSSAGLCADLTDYFQQYKVQKLTNHITAEHMERVNSYAESRPYNRIQPRASIVSKVDRTNAQLYFFDALGVEYLAYIARQCERYGMIAEISVARCELPSITSQNKDFLTYFPDQVFNIKGLDELKHHDQVIDYDTCKVPVHLFRELEVIDEELRKIQAKLKQDTFERAVIVSDHGASRLAAIYNQENPLLELEEKGKHSGRCCPVASDPQIPHAAYADGYAVLANYDRFRGGRKANVEVHGGASMEEMLVPVIVLTKKPEDIDICFVDDLVRLSGKEPASITVYANIPLSDPKLVVNGITYRGEFVKYTKHAKFVMPELKRSCKCVADFYDGDKPLASKMAFQVKKGKTQEMDYFSMKH